MILTILGMIQIQSIQIKLKIGENLSQTLKNIGINKYQDKSNNWQLLCELLASFGVVKINDQLILKWESPDIDQFTFLTKLISKLTNCKIMGRYNEYRCHWKINI